jgi:uncharacterized protein (TIGR02996 family)
MRRDDDDANRDEESGFLHAISAQPDDLTSRRVYADWLEERGDPRSEYVRLQVRLAEISEDHPEHAALQSRIRKLRLDQKPYWLALLDPPVWCLAGNILAGPRGGRESGQTHYGTPLFRPNAKVYLATLDRKTSAVLDPPQAKNRQPIPVIGQHRKSRRWIQSFVGAHLARHWRVCLVHHPGAMVALRKAGWPGFHLRKDEFVCNEGRGERATIEAFLRVLLQAEHRQQSREEAR